MSRIVIVGGGWAGVAGALAVVKGGGEAVLLERTDMLLGTGLVGGIMRNNGRFTVTEEGLAMGIQLFEIIDDQSIHTQVDFPHHRHASLYDITGLEPVIQEKLLSEGVQVHLSTAVTGVKMEQERITAVIDAEGIEYSGEVFLDTTGTAGPQKNCNRYGYGCAMCVYRCPTFGPRRSLTGILGLSERSSIRSDGGQGSISGSCKILKESLSSDLVEELNETGVSIRPLPRELLDPSLLGLKACQQYVAPEFSENVILLDTSQAKLMRPFFPLAQLRKVPGFERARYLDPLGGSQGNSIRFLEMTPVNENFQAQGVTNLFCAGEKAGPLVGHTEAIITGSIAGRNALAFSLGKEPLQLSRDTATGEAMGLVHERLSQERGWQDKYTFSGAVLFAQLQEKGFYSTDRHDIVKRVKKQGLDGIFHQSFL